MSTKTQLEWRRAKVLEMVSKGNSQSEIAGVLQVDLSIISRDVSYLRQQAKQNIKNTSMNGYLKNMKNVLLA